MNILFLTHSWEPDNTPPQKRIRRFYDACKDSGISATVICATESKSKIPRTARTSRSGFASHSNDVIRVAAPRRNNSLPSKIAEQAVTSSLFIFAAVRHAYKSRTRPKVVLATVPSLPTAYSGWFISKLLRSSLVIDLRDAWPDLATSVQLWDSEVSVRTKRARLLQTTIRILAKTGAYLFEKTMADAKGVITTSESLSELLRARGLKNVVTIRNTYPLGLPGHVGRRFDDTNNHELRVLYAGTVGRAQGLSNAVEAVRIAQTSGTKMKLLIIGKGAELDSVKKFAARRSTNVEFIDEVPATEMQLYYDWADSCLVHLRDWPPLSHTIPSKLIEIMARGIPACVSANGEPAQIVSETGCGAAVPAMNPHALASLWTSWWLNGVAEPDRARTQKWLHLRADPEQTLKTFTDFVFNLSLRQTN